MLNDSWLAGWFAQGQPMVHCLLCSTPGVSSEPPTLNSEAKVVFRFSRILSERGNHGLETEHLGTFFAPSQLVVNFSKL